MSFRGKKVKYISVAEMNQRLEYCAAHRMLVYDEKPALEWTGLRAYIVIRVTSFELTYKIGYDICTYATRLDTLDFDKQLLKGVEAFRILSRYHKFPRLEYMADVPFSAAPIVEYNPKYEKQWIQAYYYDKNAAYASVLLAGVFPDTTVSPRTGIVMSGEVGFNLYDNETVMVHEGFARWIFPLVKIEGVQKFAQHWTEIKENPKNSRQKAKAKNILNFCVGYLQNTNPFIRAYVVLTCNEQMRAIKDTIPDDWLIVNTDAIVSRVPLSLPLGNATGDFKEKRGRFAYSGNNYMFGNDIRYRGVPRNWFPKGWDITKDPLPGENNIFYFDRDENKILRVHDIKKNRCVQNN